MTDHICPICGLPQHCDQAAFEHHVNSHLNDTRPTPSQHEQVNPNGPINDTRMEGEDLLAACPICDYPFDDIQGAERDRHVNACIDGETSKAESSTPFIHRQPTRPSSKLRPSLSDESHRRQSNSYGSSTLSTPSIHESPYPHDAFGEDISFERRRQSNGAHAETERWQWDGPARPSGTTKEWKKKEKGDEWWDPLEGSVKVSDVPHNVSPGVIPVLQDLLDASVRQGTTRSAVLCRDTVNIRGVWGFDMGWACGHRNALMLISTLLSHSPSYRQSFSRETNGADPSVRRIQGWIEEAWEEGYDVEGKEHFNGKLLGGKKWIGASDVAAMFGAKGVRCELYDFPKPKAGSTRPPPSALVMDWVSMYFDEGVDRRLSAEQGSNNAFDMLMKPASDKVRRSDRYPLILQHAGHSRTVVGYEVDSKGVRHLLVFDPGKTTIPTDLRIAGISRTSSSRQEAKASSATAAAEDNAPNPQLHRHASLPRLSLTQRLSRHSDISHDSMPFNRPYTNGASEQVEWEEGLMSPVAPVKARAGADAGAGAGAGAVGGVGIRPDISVDDIDEDGAQGNGEGQTNEEMNKEGWVKKRVNKIRSGEVGPRKVLKKIKSDSDAVTVGGGHLHGEERGEKWDEALKRVKYFRADLSPAIGKPTEFQLLAFPNDEPLTYAEREERKVLSSTVIS